MNKIKFDLNDRTAVITGGAQGFGLDIAKRKEAINIINWTDIIFFTINFSLFSKIRHTYKKFV